MSHWYHTLLAFVLCVISWQQSESFQSSRRILRLSRMKRFAESEPEQTIKDLNLDQMFEVFNEADKKVPSSAVQSTTTTKAVTTHIFDPRNEAGVSNPLRFFDPAGFTKDITEDQFKLYREAEIKHGRISMLAVVGFFFGERFPLFFGGQISGPAIYHFQQADTIIPYFWLLVLSIIGSIEIYTILKAWQPLGDTLKEPLKFAKLRADYKPGNLGFDPLDLLMDAKPAYDNMLTRELNNGRLAMIAIVGMVVQELVTGQPIF